MQTRIRHAIRWLALMMATGCAAQAVAAVEANDLPRIAECRIGFDGTFKVGHWTPVWVSVSGEAAAEGLTIEVMTPDSDGVETTVSTSLPLERTRGAFGPVLLYTRIGRLGNAVQLSLVADDGRVLDRIELSTERGGFDGGKYVPLPSTAELIVELGPDSLGLASAVDEQETGDGAFARSTVQVAEVEALPTDWYGYEAATVVVLGTADVDFCRRLAADAPRLEALRKWLELGGRLVVCSGRTAPELFVEGQPLADLLPGKFDELVRLPQTQALENFAGSTDRLGQSGVQQNIPVLRLLDVRGRVDLFGRGSEIPIVARSARGLGELVFVGVDLSEPPLADWTGRAAFWTVVLRPYLATLDPNKAQHKLVSLGYDDLAGALRQRLGQSFAGMTTITFPIVAVLIIGYLLLLGPLDYLLVKKLTKRTWVAWATLPLIVLATSLGAAVLAGAAKTMSGQRINTAELVDFDLTTGRTRGMGWATLYSPDARRFDVSLLPRLPDGQPVEQAESLVSWLGLPGSGLGGMHSAGQPLDVTGVGYAEANRLGKLVGVPVLTAATKSLQSLWNSKHSLAEAAAPPIAADLAVDDDGLLVGTLSNETRALLADACLLHGQWGYRLGDLKPGRRVDVGPQLSAKRVKTIVARRAGLDVAVQREVFLADRATADELLYVMMFYEAAGGEGFAGLPNRYQADCDLSRLLDFDRAILVANGTSRGSLWTVATSDDPLGNEQDPSTVVYRFVLPVKTDL